MEALASDYSRTETLYSYTRGGNAAHESEIVVSDVRVRVLGAGARASWSRR